MLLCVEYLGSAGAGEEMLWFSGCSMWLDGLLRYVVGGLGSRAGGFVFIAIVLRRSNSILLLRHIYVFGGDRCKW